MSDDPLQPSPALLAKLGSIAVHVEEYSESGHSFDYQAAMSVVNDYEVQTWLKQMGALALLPVKRS